eukprot:TRINITY_DN67783_c0_g1_i1.p1 TRINITY_DN67783_c0_g1~~TRINITY_DN67783_c0_g1_i1.p1  ORF type:complete len:241 (+),score=45.10 TRINITY_DN67783_c0_g1_i1:129-851(+)
MSSAIDRSQTLERLREPLDVTMGLIQGTLGLILSVVLLFVLVTPILSGHVWPQWDELWWIFASIEPFSYAGIGCGIAIGFSILGSAWGIFLTGSSIAGACVRSPQIRSKNLISVIFCEAVAIYGIILAIIMSQAMKPPKEMGAIFSGVDSNGNLAPQMYADYATMANACYLLLAAGITTGFGNMACGMSVGIVGSSCAIADAHNSTLFVKILVIEIFASALGIFTIIVGIRQAAFAKLPG